MYISQPYQLYLQEIRTCEGPQEALDELNSEVRTKIALLRKHLDQLETMAKEQDLEKDRLQLQDEVKSHRHMLTRLFEKFLYFVAVICAWQEWVMWLVFQCKH